MIKITTRMLRRLAAVPRWGVVPTIRRQSVGEHSFGVVVAANWLFDQLPFKVQFYDKAYRLEVLIRALEHDGVESASGDISAPFKAKYLKQVMGTLEGDDDKTSSVALHVRAADLLEAIAFLNEEIHMGNGTVHEISRLLREEFMKHIGEGNGSAAILKAWLTETNPFVHPSMEV